MLVQLVNEDTAAKEKEKLRGLSAEDMLVYRIIEASQSGGIWTKDIRIRSNLQQV